MTCKENCLYYEICSQFSKADGANCKYYDFSNQAEKCKLFKDKSKLIDLPCKVGDTVYSFCDCFGVILPYFVETFNVSYYDKNTTVWQYEANCTNNEEDELLDSIDFEVEDIGKTVFLTREEAERALEEGENK